MAKMTDAELVTMQLNENDWYVRHARRNLQERFNGGAKKVADPNATRAGLEKIAFENSSDTRRLRGMWALQVTGGLSESKVLKALDDKAPYVRAWAIQLTLEQDSVPSEKLQAKLVELAKNDPSPVVRLYIASAAQRIPFTNCWDIL